MKKPTPLRERKKAATRATVLRLANELFRSKGYDNTTIDEICEASLISKRTFFRYFDENPFDTLRDATQTFADEYVDNREHLLAQQQLIWKSPELLAREREIDRDWEFQLARTILARAPGGDAPERRARVLAGAMIGVIRATMQEWFEGGCTDDLARMGKDHLDCLQRGFPLNGGR
jgi:AcrR family transcriptional regulator